MVRKLKFHENKLLKKVDFASWIVDNNGRENYVMRRYHIRNHEDYNKYNQLSREIRELSEKIARLDKQDPYKLEAAKALLQKLYSVGLTNDIFDLESATKISASSFCRRRLPVIMVKNKLSDSLKNATNLVESGHVRIGVEMMKDPAFLVPRNLEDFITWIDGSKIQNYVREYNNMRDDFE